MFNFCKNQVNLLLSKIFFATFIKLTNDLYALNDTFHLNRFKFLSCSISHSESLNSLDRFLDLCE